jgi:predicted metal-dependent TIM-barrel fold hydrolase
MFDVHLHPEGLTDADLQTLSVFGLTHALLPAHPLLATPTEKALLAQFQELTGPQRQRCARAGITAWAALGIHPRAIPRRGTEAVLSALPAWLQSGKARAVGPTGLYLDTEDERELLLAHAQLARRLRVPLLVTTPVAEHERRTRRTLELLRAAKVPRGLVVVDGVNGRTLPLVRALGYRAALSLHPDGPGADRAVALCRRHGSTGLLLASHAGDGASDLLALPRAHALLQRAGLSALASRVTQRNARVLLAG